MYSRRSFLSVLMAASAAGTVYGVTDASNLGAPQLRVGVLSDIHISDEAHRPSKSTIKVFENILRFYRKANVDAVIIAGDLTNSGWMAEMQLVADAWKRAFAGGPEPVRVFVTGNHEKEFIDRARKAGKISDEQFKGALYHDIRANWKALWGEEWSPFFIKHVKGYAFVGAHWGENLDEPKLRAFMDAHREALRGSKPFFFVQHAHPKNTCYGPHAWDQANGGATAAVLADYPNAVAFSGHTHYSLTDEQTVWQGAFTSIGTSALRCVYLRGGRENSKTKARMRKMCGGSQGMLMDVFPQHLRLARYDLMNMNKLGEDWVVPVPACPSAPAFAFASRARTTSAPQFPLGAAIVLTPQRGKDPNKKDEDQVVVGFPSALGNEGAISRAFDYEVRIEHGAQAAVKRVYPPGMLGAMPSPPPPVRCVFGACELPPKPWRVVVTPYTSLDVAGRALVAEGLESGI